VARGYKGKGVTIHLLVDAGGMPLSFDVTAANVDERSQVCPLLDSICIRTGKPGRPRCRPMQLAADKGYDSKQLRAKLRARGIRPEIPRRVWLNRRQPPGRKLKKRVARYVVERAFSWCQRKFRRLAIRWERLPVVFKGFLTLGFTLFWLPRLLVG
jgi:IS5 family transposase